MTGTIDVHNLVSSTVNANVDTWQFEFQPRGSLIGRVTGDAYRLAGVTRGTYVESARSDVAALTYVSRYLLVGPGTGNNLVVRETAHMTRNGDALVVDHDDWTIDCS
jgi:hypothetical protein